MRVNLPQKAITLPQSDTAALLSVDIEKCARIQLWSTLVMVVSWQAYVPTFALMIYSEMQQPVEMVGVVVGTFAASSLLGAQDLLYLSVADVIFRDPSLVSLWCHFE